MNLSRLYRKDVGSNTVLDENTRRLPETTILFIIDIDVNIVMVAMTRISTLNRRIRDLIFIFTIQVSLHADPGRRADGQTIAGQGLTE